MTALKHSLQREVFKPNEERLIAVVNVTKAGKKKKASFLCAAVTLDKPETVSVYQVKKTDKETKYKKRMSWRLRDLKIIDGKDESNETPEFDVHFEKNYKWVASSVHEKNNFIISLWKLYTRYLPQRKPNLLNVSMRMIEESLQSTEISRAQRNTDGVGPGDDYQELTTREESDLERMMSQTENAISNIEAFAESLSRDLSLLDGANVRSIMGSEAQVTSLMSLLDEALDELEKLETRLTKYDEQLKAVRDQMEQMEDKDRHMVTESTNRKALLAAVENVVNSLDVHDRHITALEGGNLAQGIGLKECISAANEVLKALQVELGPGLLDMRAVKEQKDKLTKLSRDFSQRLKSHLLDIFGQHGSEVETLAKHSSLLCIPKHLACHKELLPYADLMKWLKVLDRKVFLELSQGYTNSLCRVYEKEVREFFEAAKQKAVTKGIRVGPSTFKMTGSSSSVNRDDASLRSSPRPPHRGGPLRDSSRKKSKDKKDDSGSDNISRSGSFSSVDSADQTLDMRGRFDRVFDSLLAELEPVCTSEQEFVEKFFDLYTEEAEGSETASPAGSVDSSDGAAFSKRRLPSDHTDVKERQQLNENVRSKRDIINKEKREQAKKIMQDLFVGLDTELQAFIQFGDKLDSFNTMYMLVKIGQYVITNQLSGAPVSYLSQQLGNCLIVVKRLFDKFIGNLKKQIDEMKIQKNKKCGILPFVAKFEEFAKTSEVIFKHAERRTDLDRAYHQLCRVVFDNVQRVSAEHLKTPQAVVMLENYHHMFRILSRLKISCLENEKREAKQKYNDSLKLYVRDMLGRPMEKLNIFFEGVQERINAGVKAEEVGYQLAFSKQELRKCIKEYPVKEIKKGLEHLYKKVEKHLCDEENLLQVVWHSMQEEFIQQYKNFEELISRCYPGSMITFEFTINDVLEFFSNIAQSH